LRNPGQGIPVFQESQGETAAFLEKAAAKTLIFGLLPEMRSTAQKLKFFGYLSFKKDRVLQAFDQRNPPPGWKGDLLICEKAVSPFWEGP